MALDGETALEILESEKVDLILLDIVMPGIDGYQTCQRIKQQEKNGDTPVLFITAKTDEESIAQAYEVGGIDYVTKPFKPKELIARVKTHLQIKSLNDDIAESHRDLEKTLEDLKQTQNQLIQQEKMAGLGTLTAGVAHEINNPTNFVAGAGYNLNNRLTEFKSKLLDLAGGDDAEPEFVTFFEQEFAALFSENKLILDGAKRIANIVKDLSTFTRMDSAEKKHTVLSEIIESTIHLVKTRHEKVAFKTDYADDPAIECYPSKLSQVFMNILVNACQAIQEKEQETGFEGNISISITRYVNEVVIRIQDNGCGMDEQTLSKVFEPFYTTKEVGKGTGLGMAISFGIIAEHNGNINFDSTLGVGTIVTITLPG